MKNSPQMHNEMKLGFLYYTDDAETLNIRADPKTGKEITPKTRAAAANKFG